MRSILDPKFKYVPSASTDIRKTFARVRREQATSRCRRHAWRNPRSRSPNPRRLTMTHPSIRGA